MSTTTLAYLAGVIDSDGCITIKRRRVKTAAEWTMSGCIFVRQVSDEAVSLAQATFGGRIRQHAASIPGGRPLFQWYVERKLAVHVAKKLLPYLRIKYQQAQILIAFGEFLAKPELRRLMTYFRWNEDEPCYGVDEAASIKGCSRATIYQAIFDGAIPSRIIPGRGHGTRIIPKRFWDGYRVAQGCRTLPPEYIEARDEFRRRIHSLNGPTRGIPTAARLA